MTDEPREIKIDTPDGKVIAHGTTVDPTPQTVTVVAGDNLAWLQSLGIDGTQFVSHYLPTACGYISGDSAQFLMARCHYLHRSVWK